MWNHRALAVDEENTPREEGEQGGGGGTTRRGAEGMQCQRRRVAGANLETDIRYGVFLRGFIFNRR